MSQTHATCAVCRTSSADGTRMSKVVIEGRALELCRTHAASVLTAMPETFEDLRALFVGVAIEANAPAGQTERRSVIERRGFDDRRVFPPRPEGRRRAGGRRLNDIAD